MSEAPSLPTSVALPPQSPTTQAVLVSARPSAAICSFHELGSEGEACLSKLQLSGTHCRSSPLLPVHQSQSVSSRAQDSSFQTGLSLTFPPRTIEETELKWTELKVTYMDWGHHNHQNGSSDTDTDCDDASRSTDCDTSSSLGQLQHVNNIGASCGCEQRV